MTGRSRRRRIGLEGRERLVAVHLGHDDVEQDDVDRRRRPGRAGSSRASRPFSASTASWPIDVQQADEEAPIERGVVDDEDASAGHRASPAIGRRRRGASMAARAVAERLRPDRLGE